ncbi:MAG: DUF4267 domain-containing protein [Bdellovibrio sp.]|nr:DUF4267 domain-containing protein [Bdellovibrio sp.]
MSLQQILSFIPAMAGLVALIIGLLAVITPAKASKGFGIEASGPALHYVVATGVRDIFIGLIMLVLYWHGDTKIIGACFICIAVVAIADFTLTFKHGSKKQSVVHAAGAIFSIIYGSLVILQVGL